MADEPERELGGLEIVMSDLVREKASWENERSAWESEKSDLLKWKVYSEAQNAKTTS